MILNKPGDTWHHRDLSEIKYPEVPKEEVIKVRPRETFIKELLNKHDETVSAYQHYRTASAMATFAMPGMLTASTATIYPYTYPDLEYTKDGLKASATFYDPRFINEVKTGLRGQVRSVHTDKRPLGQRTSNAERQ